MESKKHTVHDPDEQSAIDDDGSLPVSELEKVSGGTFEDPCAGGRINK